MVVAVRQALDSTADNKARVAATIAAYFAFVDDDGAAFRLVFESDLVNEDAVRERVDRVTHECAQAISEVIAEDAGLSTEESTLLAVGLVGMAQGGSTAGAGSRRVPGRGRRGRLVAAGPWRGIGTSRAPPDAQPASSYDRRHHLVSTSSSSRGPLEVRSASSTPSVMVLESSRQR